MPTPSAWLLATRPRTLAAGAVPVAVGTALASALAPIDWKAAFGCLFGAILIQIGTNFANDALDSIKGADGPERIGPQRAVASGLISARAMLLGAAVVLLAAFVIGLYLTSFGGWPIFVLGLVSLACAILYTGGPFPLAYHGLGDCFVFLFFGLFAVIGSGWVQLAPHAARIPSWWWLVAAAVGLQATAIIVVNNLRDLVSDAKVGKRTLCVRLGDRPSRIYFGAVQVAAALCWWGATALSGIHSLAIPASVATLCGFLLILAVRRSHGSGLNRYLALSAAAELITGLSLLAAFIMAPHALPA